MNKIQINNYESVETILKNNNEPPKYSSFNFNGEYDGENAKVNYNVIDNGKQTEHASFKFTNNELLDLLGTHANSNPIDKRLVDDFSKNKRNKKNKKNKNKTKKIRRRIQKNKK
jgi:hypothetical protein